MKKYFCIFLLICFFSSIGQNYDQTFNGTGLIFPPYSLTGNPNLDSTSATNILLLPDGKIILYGYQINDTFLRKFNADGSIDTTFGVNGVLIIPFVFSDALVSGYFPFCKLLNDGKILLIKYKRSVASTSAINPHITIARINANGSIDNTFGTNGVINITNIPLPSSEVYQEYFETLDGFITILSRKQYTYQNESRYLPILIRLKPDYTLDENFSSDGIYIPEELDYSNLYGSSAAILLEDQSIIVGVDNKKIIKVTQSGELDLTFGNSGIKTLPNNSFSIIKVANNKFWISGSSSTQSLITRYNSDFTVDTFFGTNGSVVGSFGKTKLQADNKVVSVSVIGAGGFETFYSSFVKRYSEDGTLESSQQFVFQNSLSQKLNNLAIQPDGKILICGGYMYLTSQHPYILAPVLARLSPNLLNNEVAIKDFIAVKTFPNPFINKIELSFELPNSEITSINLYDLQGRLVINLTRNKLFSQGGNFEEYYMSELSNGTYFIRITTKSGLSKTLKVIKS